MRKSVLVSLVIAVVAGTAAADTGRIEIGPTDTFPIIIDTPGSYVLTADLHTTQNGTAAIEITSDQVTLDLGGHVIRGPGSDQNGTGIYGYDRSGIVVHNGTITEFANGIIFGSGTFSFGVNVFHDLVISDMGQSGLTFSGGVAHDIVATNVSVPAYTGAGVSCGFCSLTNVTVRASFKGISLFKGSAVNCSSIGNETGFSLRWASLTGGVAMDNSGHGVDGIIESTVIGVAASGNGAYGINLDSGGNNNAVNCTAANNGAADIVGCGDGNGCHQNYMP